MYSQGAIKFKRSFVLGAVLVLFILLVYTLSYRSKAKHNAAEREHADWLKQMGRDRSLINDAVEKQAVTQSVIVPNTIHEPRMSMVLPADIPEDIHRPQTEEMSNEYMIENDRDTADKMENMALPNSQKIPNYQDENEEMNKDDYGDEEKDYNQIYSDEQTVENEDKSQGQEISATVQFEIGKMQQAIAQTDIGKTHEENFQNESEHMQQANIQDETVKTREDNELTEYLQQASGQNEHEKAQEENAQIKIEQKQELISLTMASSPKVVNPPILMPEYVRNHNAIAYPIQIAQERANIAEANIAENIKPIVRPADLRDSNVPSFSVDKLNSSEVNIPYYHKAENPHLNGNELSETNRRLLGGNFQSGVFENKNKPLPSYHDKNDALERNIFQLHGVRNQEFQPNEKAFTLPSLLENRMNMHGVLKDMDDVVNYGSPASDDDNKKGWKWNMDENESNLFDEKDKNNKFANLMIQVNKHAELVTGTRLMLPQYKSKIEYPTYLTPIDWNSSLGHIKVPIFECAPMQIQNNFIRICIYPPAVKSDVLTNLKSEASWEFNALQDMQIALFDHRESMLIDIGASVGVFSLAAAALNRKAIAVEPYPSNIQVFRQSVLLNQFTDHIALFQAVVSDSRGKVLIKRFGDHMDNVYIQTAEDDEQYTIDSLVVNTVTLDDIEKVCPSRIAVLKIDVPGFVKKILDNSYYFFKYIYVTHVFMQWDTSDRDLSHFLVRFFVERGYQPYSDLKANTSQLRIEEADFWTNDIVIWKL